MTGQFEGRKLVSFNKHQLKQHIQEIYYLILPMITISADKTKLVTNFILVHAPTTTPLPSQPHLHSSHPTPHSPLSPQQPLSLEAGQQLATISLLNRKKYPKDDYQKNITINVVKCCIRQMLGHRYQTLLRNKCLRMQVTLQQLQKMVEPILKEVVISLGDLKNMLTSGGEGELALKKVFCWFLQWYLRNRYVFYLLSDGKMNHKERYIEYKNKYMLYLLRLIRENKDINSPIRTMPSHPTYYPPTTHLPYIHLPQYQPDQQQPHQPHEEQSHQHHEQPYQPRQQQFHPPHQEQPHQPQLHTVVASSPLSPQPGTTLKKPPISLNPSTLLFIVNSQ